MGMLRVKAAECRYKETDRLVKEQFINKLNGVIMITETREFTAINNNGTLTNSHIFAWVKWVKPRVLKVPC